MRGSNMNCAVPLPLRRIACSRIAPLIASAAVVATSGTQAADLSEVYAIALQNDPVLAAARAGSESRREVVVQSRAALLPRLAASAGSSQSSVSVDGLNQNGLPNPEVDVTRRSWGANLSQTVIDVPSWFGYLGARAIAKQAEWDLETAAQQLITRVAETYLSILRGPGGAGVGRRLRGGRAPATRAGAAAFRRGPRGDHRRTRCEGRVRQHRRQSHSSREQPGDFLRGSAHADRPVVRGDRLAGRQPADRRSGTGQRRGLGRDGTVGQLRNQGRPRGPRSRRTRLGVPPGAPPADRHGIGQLRRRQRQPGLRRLRDPRSDLREA